MGIAWARNISSSLLQTTVFMTVLLNTTSVSAQDETSEVTGTRIKRADPLDYAEITTVTSEQIEMSGVTNIEQLLTQLPTFTLQGQKTSHPEGRGVVTVDLRNLGPQRTLVLLNGRRIVGAAGPSVDLSIVPVSAIDRVEVMYGDACAIYGADAIAGVVNIILKQDFEGIEARVRGGTSTHGDGEELGVSTTMGTSSDKGNIMATLDWSHQSPVYQRDREWAKLPCEGVYYGYNGDETSVCGSPISPGGHSSLNFPDSGMSPPDWIFHGSDADFTGVNSFWTSGPMGNPDLLYNMGTQGTLSGQSDRFHLVTSGHYDLSKSVTAYMDGLFSYQKHGSRSAGQGIGADSNEIYTDLPTIHYSNPFIPHDFWNDVIDVYGINHDAPYLSMAKRTNDVGAIVSETSSSTFRAIVGLKGEITSDYNWDVFVNYSRYETIDLTTNNIDLERFHTSLDPEACYATPGCVLANMFGEGTMQGDVRDFIGFDATDTKQWDLINAGGQFGAAPFNLPGGKFSAVIGADVRFERALNVPDSKIQDGVTATQTSLFQANRTTIEEFLELHAPIIKGVKGVDVLNVDLAGSFSQTKPFGSHFTYRAGLVYGPLPDIKFRGALSSSLKLPTMQQYSGSPYSSNERVIDPCSNWANLPSDPDNEFIQSQCQWDLADSYISNTTSTRTIVHPNDHLDPETVKSANIGIILTPTFMPRKLPLVATIDWYKTRIKDSIDLLGPQEILTNCYTIEDLQGYCDYVHRNSETGALAEIESWWRNRDSIKTSGFDFSLNLGFPLLRTVTGTLGFQGNIQREFIEKVSIGHMDAAQVWQSIQDMNKINLATGMPKYRFRWSLNIGTPIWQIENRVRLIAPMDIVGATDAMAYRDVEAVAYWDTSAKVVLGDFNVVAGVNNILDRDPPYFPGTGYNGNPQVYNFIGRYIFAHIGYEFQ